MPTASESPIIVTAPGGRAGGVAGAAGLERTGGGSALGFGRGLARADSVGVGTASVPSTTLSSGAVAARFSASEPHPVKTARAMLATASGLTGRRRGAWPL